uniref:MIF4G domain-containing protein n=1 Tax=Panagrolaimus sp. ES5 TaxID=591445 RepID=A0AC34GNB7_9BILA
MDSDGNTFVNSWVDDVQKRCAAQRKNIETLKNAEPLEGAKLSKLDSSLKKLTAFMKKTKSISSKEPATLLIPELSKLNVLKFLDEIATNVCEAKIKSSDVNDLVTFVVHVCSLYPQFSDLLLVELKKQFPTKKSEKIENPTKFKIDLKFLGELILNGVFAKPGMDLLGSALAYLVATDATEFNNVPLLMPFCKQLFFDFTGTIPLSQKDKINDTFRGKIPELITPVLTESNRKAIINLMKKYFDDLIKHVNTVRVKMNKIHKGIKRQERTKGDATQADRLAFEAAKQQFDRVLQYANDLGECLGYEVPAMDEEPSDDELDEAMTKQLDTALNDGKTSLWPDKDSQSFYEQLEDVVRLSPMKANASAAAGADEGDAEPEAAEDVSLTVAESIDAVDFSELEIPTTGEAPGSDEADEEENEEIIEEQQPPPLSASSLPDKPTMDSMYHPQFIGANMTDFMENLSCAINRDLIDRAASHFVSLLNKKGNRKKLIQHFLNSPRDRLDLLPFYGRFLATIKPVVPDVVNQTLNSLLLKFRQMASAKIEPPKKEKGPRIRKIDDAVFLSRFLGELTKFKILPKAEALACLRSLLVDLKSYKVEMASVFIECCGIFLYRSSDTAAKMSVVLSVVQKKISFFKDQRHKILLENAYFSVIPPEESQTSVQTRNPLHSYISLLIRSMSSSRKGRDPVKILAGIDWTDSRLVNFLCTELSDVCTVRYDNLADIADNVRSLTDDFPDVGIFVTDNVLEAIRIALETNKIAFQQRLFGSCSYLNWLYVCGVCEFKVVIQVLYQLISLGINLESYSLEQLLRRTNRIRIAADLVTDVWHYVDRGYPQILLDNFIHYLLNFYFSTQELWKERSEELREFPFDVIDKIQKMIKIIIGKGGKKRDARAAKFAKDLESSQAIIASIEKKYRNEVKKQITATQKLNLNDPTALESIKEEDDGGDDEELDDEDEEYDEEDEEEHAEENDDGGSSQTSEVPTQYVDAEDPEHVHVRRVERKFDENDEEFNREFEKIFAESLQHANNQPRQTAVDLTVPPSVRQKFERKVQFDADEPPFDPARMFAQPQKPQNVQMALMTRGKGQKPVLKSVHLEISQSMKDSWGQEREKSTQERNIVKNITLQMNDRIQQRVDDDNGDPPFFVSQTTFPQHECQIPAGPRRSKQQ